MPVWTGIARLQMTSSSRNCQTYLAKVRVYVCRGNLPKSKLVEQSCTCSKGGENPFAKNGMNVESGHVAAIIARLLEMSSSQTKADPCSKAISLYIEVFHIENQARWTELRVSKWPYRSHSVHFQLRRTGFLLEVATKSSISLFRLLGLQRRCAC